MVFSNEIVIILQPLNGVFLLVNTYEQEAIAQQTLRDLLVNSIFKIEKCKDT